ncbi:MexH family multidrug efflux RND transporter periplasmic adaptor subunit [Planctomycetota bacterium]|nr:MexH family multidrug efflux RND transporter periplasmic adaptor subunit [Planctomycetota bacterium]
MSDNGEQEASRPVPVLWASPRLWSGLAVGLLIGLAVGAGGAGALLRPKSPAPVDPSVQTTKKTKFPVEIGATIAAPVERSLTATGAIEAFETVRVAARVAGIVETVLVAEGDAVSAGQPLVALDAARFRLAVAGAEAALAAAQSRLSEADQQWRRRLAAEKAQVGTVPAGELDQLAARVDQARADLASSTVNRDRAALDLKESIITAPFPGIVQSRDIQTGSALLVGQAVATLIQRDPLQVRFALPVADAAILRIGQAIEVVVGGAQPVPASVRLIAAAADRATRQVTVLARFAPENHPDAGQAVTALRPGSFAAIRIVLPAGPPVISIPDLAVRPSERGFLVFSIDGDGDSAVAREHRVETGERTTDGRVVIRSGLTPGQRIVVRGAEPLREGSPVEIRDQPAPAP